MHQLYQDAVQFYVVYIQEAHPSDGWQMEVNERESVIYAQEPVAIWTAMPPMSTFPPFGMLAYADAGVALPPMLRVLP